MVKSAPPVIFMAFANEKASEEGRLRLLGKERQEITRALDEMANRGECEIIVRENVSPDDIYEAFTAERYKDRIAIFHYAGHANSFGILLESHGSHTENIHFKVEGLVGFLAQQQGLRLVFLNACSTKAQATMLQAKGVPNIIATRQSINDAVAAELAEKFYRSLAGKKPIERALAEAGSIVSGKTHDAALRDLSFEGMEEEKPETTGTGIPWDLYGTGEWWIGADEGLSLTRTLRKASKKYLDNYTQLLKPMSISGFSTNVEEWLDADAMLQQKATALLHCIPSLWEAKKTNPEFAWHTVMMAMSGLGKTASMLRIWQHILADENGPIPIYIPLNDFNQYANRKQGDFIIRFIAKEYFGQTYGDAVLEAGLRKLLESPQEDGQPSVIFLLDAINEVVLDKESLIQEITALKKYKGAQLLVSTRAEGALKWAAEFQKLELKSLDKQVVVQFLRKQPNVLVPTNARLLELLCNPMMLAMYLALANATEQLGGMGKFKPNPSTQGELIYNFYEATMARYLQREESNAYKQALLKWTFKHLMPRIGHAMEINQVNNPSAFSLSRSQFKEIILEALKEFDDEAIMEGSIKAFPESFEIWDAILDESMQKPNFAILRQIVIDDTQMMVKVGNAYQFIHPIMRDFLSAMHILNDVQRSEFDTETTLGTWTARPLPIYIRKMIGEIESEYKNKPFFQNGTWQQVLYPTRLRLVLDRCRSSFEVGEVGYGVVNVLHIWQELRDNILVGEDLSNLLLLDIDLSNTCFSLPGLPPVSFDSSYMEAQNWLHDGHNLGVQDIYYYHDGNWILSVGDDYTLKEWDLQSGNCWGTYTGHTGELASVAYNFTGSRAFTSSTDGTVIRWILREEEAEHHEKNTQLVFENLVGGNDYFKVVFGSMLIDDVKTQVAASCSKEGKAIIWSCENGAILREHDVPAGALPMAFSPVDGLVLYAHANVVIGAYAENDESDWVLGGEADESQPAITTIAFRADGNAMCIGDAKGGLYAYQLPNGECLGTFSLADETPVVAVSLIPDGTKALVALIEDNCVYIWDIAAETLLVFGEHPRATHYVQTVKCSADGFRAISGSSGGDIVEWDFSNEAPHLQTINKGYSLNLLEILLNKNKNIHEAIDAGELNPQDVSIRILGEVAYSPDGKQAAWTVETGCLQIWDLAEKRCERIIKAGDALLYSIAYAPNGLHIVAGGKALTRWNVKTGQGEVILDESCYYLAHHPTASQVLGLLREGVVVEMDINSGRVMMRMTAKEYSPSCCLYTPDGTQAIIGAEEGELIIIELSTGKELKRIQTGQGEINAILLHADTSKLLTCSENNMAQVWDFPTMELLASLQVEEAVNDGCFSAEGKHVWLATSNDNVLVWDWKAEKQLHSLQGHFMGIYGIASSPNDKQILTASMDGTVRAWNAKTHKIETIFPSLELQISGCSMKDLHANNEVPEALSKVMLMYGAEM